MRASFSWLKETRRVALLLALAAFSGWIVGETLLVFALALLGLQVYWLAQLRRIQGWLSAPDSTPPEGIGIWGDVFDRIYNLQRRNTEAHTRLQSTVDYLRDSFTSMRDGAIMLDSTGAIEWSNPAVESLLGVSYPQDKGQGILNLLRAPEFHEYFLTANFNTPLQLDTNSDPALHLRIEITCFGEGDRLMFIRDVTKIVRLEQMRRDFVGNVSHELRTPLTVISGYLATFLSDSKGLDSRYQKPLEQMEQQAQRMESLLKDLLWLSRLEGVRNTDRKEQVDVCGLLQELRDEIRENYPDRVLNLELSSNHHVTGDYRELYSAVSNLVINALKYSPEDRPVRISWAQKGEEYQLAVVDQGQGIDASHIPRLTERFYRVDDSRSSMTGGTGLGLAIVKHVAAGHNARLKIESVVGLGSSFMLIFMAQATK